MKVQLFDGNVNMPKIFKNGDAGYDLFMPEAGTLKPGMNIVDLKVGFEIPEGYMGLVLPRSSSAKKGIIAPAPPIDSNYRGSITGYIFNGSGDGIKYESGHRLLQISIFKIITPELVEATLDTDTERGNSKEGSSGL